MAYSRYDDYYEYDEYQIDKQEYENHKIYIENVPEQYLGRLIGKQGSRLKEIKSKFNDKVEIEITEKRITISGSNLTNVRDCERLINKLVDEIRVNGCLNKNSVENHFNKKETLGLYIDSKFHGSLIGKNGSVIRAITGKLNNVNISFSKEADLQQQQQNVFITGMYKIIL